MNYDPKHIPKRPSPAVAFIGRQNSGKTSLLEKVIAHLSTDGYKVGTIKHHGHPNFEIDIPGKDSYRHRAAGASTTAILSSGRLAFTQDLDHEMDCYDVLRLMPGYDVVLVEGFRGVGIPSIELFRADNPKDEAALPAFLDRLANNTENPTPQYREEPNASPDNPDLPAAVVTDMPQLAQVAAEADIPVFGFEEIERLCSFIEKRFVKAPLSIAIQAGGESKRMGQSKALAPFLGRPLIEHMLELVSEFADELIVTTNEEDKLAYLQALYPEIKIVHDIKEERGALPGLYTALQAATNDLVGVVACDMIAFRPRILKLEAIMLQASGKDAIVPQNNDYWEPFAGVYRKSICEAALANVLATGSKRMQDLLQSIDCQAFNSEPLQRPGSIDPFANVNTPHELEQAEVLYRIY